VPTLIIELDDTRKHLQGQHDQASHGVWARYGAQRQAELESTAERIAGVMGEVRTMADVMAYDPRTPEGKEMYTRAAEAIFGTFEHPDYEVGDVEWRRSTSEGGLIVEGAIYRKVDPADEALSADVLGALPRPLRPKVGTFERVFSSDGTEVEHHWMQFTREVQGNGMGTDFIRHSENSYIVMGVQQIKVTTGLDQGGYTWARMGFNFDDPAKEAPGFARRLGIILSQDELYNDLTDEQRSSVREIIDRVNTAVEDGDDASLPTAYEISQAGRLPGMDPRLTPWPGYTAMAGTQWTGFKDLSSDAARYRRLIGMEKRRANAVSRAVAKAFEEWCRYCEETYPQFNPEDPTLQQLDDEFRIYNERLVGVAELKEEQGMRKHLQGQHDQRSHGVWARYGAQRKAELEDTAERMAAVMTGGIRPMADIAADQNDQEIEEVGEAIWGTFNNGEYYVADLASYAQGGGYATFSGNIRRVDDDQVIGEFSRMYSSRDGGYMKHALFEIAESEQASGLGTEFIRHAENAYIVLGIPEIHVLAGLDQGGYVWARMGFNFDDPEQQATTFADELEDQLRTRGGLTNEQKGHMQDLLDRTEEAIMTGAVDEIPTAYEFSQAGRMPGMNPKDGDTWPGYEMMAGSWWNGNKKLDPGSARMRQMMGVEKQGSRADRVSRAVGLAFDEWYRYCKEMYPDFDPEDPTAQQLHDEYRIYGERLAAVV